MSLRSQWVYQGYNGRAGEYRRSPGMSPETGWIDLAATDLKNIRIVGRDLPWRTVGGTEVNGGLDILTWSKMKSSATVTSLPPLPAPQGGGLNPFGNLDLTTYDANGAKVRGMTYVDVYVGLSGIEEITEGLDEIETHQVGNIRVPLTDVRYYMQRCSPLFCNINKRLKSGDWDATSTKDGAQTPWAIDEVLKFLFSLLPGSPNIVSWSELYQLKGDIDPPSDIIGRGEPAKEWIEKVLERAGLEPHLLPDNTWAIHGKYSTKFSYKEMAGPGGAVVEVPSGGDPGFHYERKTSTQTGRPPAVIVHGGRRIKRGSFQMIPVLQDLDGFIYPMEDVVNRWGYSMDQVNKQVFSRNDTRFRDVPPTPESGGDGTLHEKRKKVLQNAYRMYAPAFMFTGPDGDDSAVDTQTAAQPNAMINPDRKFVAYLPIKDCAWYQSEFQAIRTGPPSKDTVGPGDKEDYVLSGPVAWGNRVASVLVQNPDLIDQYFQESTKGVTHFIDTLNSLINEYTAKQTRLAAELQSAFSNASKNYSSQKLQQDWAVSQDNLNVAIGNDVTKAAANVGIQLGGNITAEQAIGSIALTLELVHVDALRQATQAQLDQQQTILDGWNSQIDNYKKSYLQRRGMRAMYNVPFSLLEPGIVNFDLNTGLLHCSEPLCMVDKPLFNDSSSVVVISDGGVVATWGYELKDNNIQAFTTFLFSPGEGADDDVPDVEFNGCCCSSPLKAVTAQMNGVMYLLDAGTPVNFNACFSEAKQKASSLVRMPRVVTGYVYELQGLWAAWLGPGITSVQHKWNGAAGQTMVGVNAPGARMPLGPAFRRQGWVPSADMREIAEFSSGKD